MSFHEELGKLDADKLGIALGAIVGKTTFEPSGSIDAAGQLTGHYKALSVLPDAIGNTLEQLDPEIDSQRIQDLRAGATFLACVLSEYAQLAEMQAQFPDAPSAE
jgi:hypothetical protein